MTVYFKDLFDGAGDFSARTPDVGTTYAQAAGSEDGPGPGALTDVKVDGSGALLCTDNYAVVYSIPTDTAPSGAYRLTIRLATTTPEAADEFRINFYKMDGGFGSYQVLRFRLDTFNGSINYRFQESEVEVVNYSDTIAVGATVVVQIDVDPAGPSTTLTIDGNLLNTYAGVPDPCQEVHFYMRGDSTDSSSTTVESILYATPDETETPAGPTPTEITNRVPVDITGDVDGDVGFFLVVPGGGDLLFRGVDDADYEMSVKLGSMPTGIADADAWGSYDSTTGKHNILIPNAAAGTYYVLIHYTGAVASGNLVGCYDADLVWTARFTPTYWTPTNAATWDGAKWVAPSSAGAIELERASTWTLGIGQTALKISGATASSPYAVGLAERNTLEAGKLYVSRAVLALPPLYDQAAADNIGGVPNPSSNTMGFVLLDGMLTLTGFWYTATNLDNAIAESPSTPDAPTDLVAVAYYKRATLAFTESAGATGYTVTSDPPGGVDATPGGGGTFHYITGLTNGVEYTFTVVASNTAGDSADSDPSNAVTPFLDAPASVVATAYDGYATITFTGAEGALGYSIASVPAGGVDLTADSLVTTARVVFGLTNGTEYTFVVTASDGVDAADSFPSNAVTPTATPVGEPWPDGIEKTVFWLDRYAGSDTLATHVPDVGGAYSSSTIGSGSGGALTFLALDTFGDLKTGRTATPAPITALSAFGPLPGTWYRFRLRSWTISPPTAPSEDISLKVWLLHGTAPCMLIDLHPTTGGSGVIWVLNVTIYDADGTTSLGNDSFTFTPSGSPHDFIVELGRARYPDRPLDHRRGVWIESATAFPTVPELIGDTAYGESTSFPPTPSVPAQIPNAIAVQAYSATVALRYLVDEIEVSVPTGGTFPMPLFSGIADNPGGPLAGLHEIFPMPLFAGRAGAQLVRGTVFPMPLFAGTAKVSVVGRLAEVFPMPLFAGHAIVPRIGRLAEVFPMPLFAGHTGARFADIFPMPLGAGHAQVGAVARLADLFPMPLFAGAATVHAVAHLAEVFPMPITGGYAVLAEVFAMPLFAGHAQVGALTAYEGYSIALITGPDGERAATTHLTMAPFNRIVRFGGKYYGIADNGWYLLEGETYAGTEIVPVLLTAAHDFDSPMLKRPRYLYLSGQFTRPLTASVEVVDGRANNSYNGIVQAGRVRQQRITFGRGVKGEYLAFGVTGFDELDSALPEAEVLTHILGGS